MDAKNLLDQDDECERQKDAEGHFPAGQIDWRRGHAE